MRLLIAGGGTGGHLFPALAVARAVMREAPNSSVLFVGTRHGLEAEIMPKTEFPIDFVKVRGLRGTGLLNTMAGMKELPVSLAQSGKIIRRFRPDFALGVGGYASGPALAAANLLRVPTGIQEQNSVMGTTNRILSRFVDRIFTSWPNTEPEPPAGATRYLGNPIREDLMTVRPAQPHVAFHLLIFGGSRGARSVNEAMAENVGALVALRDRVKIMHQTGKGVAAEMADTYRKIGIDADVREFITDMAAAYRWADLVVCRSGASSLAELTALGKPAVVSPYPYAIGDHQFKNAKTLEAAGAVRIVPDNQLKHGALMEQILSLIDDAEALIAMAENARALGKPSAARDIAREILQFQRSSR